MNNLIDRRRFLKQSGAAGITLGLATYMGSIFESQAEVTPARAVKPGDKLSCAVIGTNGRGLAHVDCLTNIPNIEITTICDVDDRAIKKGVDETVKQQANQPKGVKDFRQVLADPAIDFVTIATPDHWHTTMDILALAAGKHVYVEKPCSQNPHEGELLVAAVQKYQRVLQMGAQRRSFPNLQQVISDIHGGIIGRAYFAKAWYCNERASIGHGKEAPVPEWLDYELWQGPAPRRPYIDNLIHYNWHWRWMYGTGEALNNGTHEVDVCRWALGEDWPTRVSSNGGRYQFQDDWETPDTQTISWDYADGKSITWEGRSCNNFPVEKMGRGVLIFGTKGTALLDGNSCTVYDQKNKVIKEMKGNPPVDPTNTISASGLSLDQLHVANFIDAIRTGSQPSCPAEEGHKSVGMLHLGNISWRVKRELVCDPANGHILNDGAAMKLWRRKYEPGWEPKV